jgi:hypothetical protein
MDNDNAMIVCKQSIHFFGSDGNGHWKEVTTLSMPNVFCTMSVALSGKTAVVGVPIDYSGEGRDRVRKASKFVPITSDEGKGTMRGANVGYSVAIDADAIIVGVPSMDCSAQSGRVYVLHRRSSKTDTTISDEDEKGWVQHSQLEPACQSSRGGSRGKHNFGMAIAIRGNTVVGSDGDGSVFVFKFDPTVDSYRQKQGNVVEEQHLSSGGTSFAISGEGGILVGCKNINGKALYYQKQHRGHGRYVMQQERFNDSPSAEQPESKEVTSHQTKTDVSIYGSNSHNQLLIMGATSTENKRSTSGEHNDRIYKRVKHSWEMIAEVGSGSSNDESMFGNSVAISRNQMMVVSSSNVFAYSLLED